MRLHFFIAILFEHPDADSFYHLRLMQAPSAIRYAKTNPKTEFIEKVVDEHILKGTNIKFDNLNYIRYGDSEPVTLWESN